MNVLPIFLVIYSAMIATSFWESYVEGRNAWGKKKLGWVIRFSKNISLHAYHFFLFGVMFPLLLSLPLVIYGWNTELFGILISAYFSGVILEDFMWFVVNPKVKLTEWNSNFASYYPWFKIGKIEFPVFHAVYLLLSVASWFFFWK